jgi:cytochrome c peroxidase
MDHHETPLYPIHPIENTNPELIELGETLFHDPQLSREGSVSCSSCHDLTKGGADNKRHSVGVDNRLGIINAPSIFNVSLNFRQFWDGRSLNLTDQIDGPITNPIEMDTNWDNIIHYLQSQSHYKQAFEKQFSNGVTPDNVRLAIVAFEESLSTPDSPFDAYLEGDTDALTQTELKGYELFLSYGCVSCHQGAGVGGNMFQKLGVMKPYFSGETVEVADLGRYNITQDSDDMHVFKVPSLRNVALTAPYLHNGDAETLEEAVRIMMIYQIGVEPVEADISAIVSFLKTLTGQYKGESL